MSAKLETATPTGRKKEALGKERRDAAFVHPSQGASSPDGANDTSKWPVVKSGALLSFVTSGSRGWARYYSESGPLFLRVGNLDHDSVSLDLRDIQCVEPPTGAEVTRTKVQTSDILISVTADVGMVGLVPSTLGEAYINQHVALARPLPTVHPPYLAWCLTSPPAQRQFHQLQRGATKVGLGLDDIRAVDVPLPPLPEQRRIVAEIEKQFTRLEAGVAALRRVQANLKRYRAAVLKAACEGRLVATEAELAKTRSRKATFETGEALLARILTERRHNWQGRGKYKEPAVPDTTKLLPLPDGWAWLTVEAIGFVTKLAGFEYTKYVKYSPDGDLAVIKAENAGRSGFKRTEISRIRSSTVAHLTRSQLTAGDLLMVFVGAGTGNVARVPDDQPYFLGPNIAMIRVEPRAVSGAYLEMFLRSPVGHSLTFGFIKAVAQPSLSMGTIRMIPIAIPPLAEQTRIVAELERRLSVVEESEAVVSANLQRATRLRQSILQKAFSGDV